MGSLALREWAVSPHHGLAHLLLKSTYTGRYQAMAPCGVDGHGWEPATDEAPQCGMCKEHRAEFGL